MPLTLEIEFANINASLEATSALYVAKDAKLGNIAKKLREDGVVQG